MNTAFSPRFGSLNLYTGSVDAPQARIEVDLQSDPGQLKVDGKTVECNKPEVIVSIEKAVEEARDEYKSILPQVEDKHKPRVLESFETKVGMALRMNLAELALPIEASKVSLGFFYPKDDQRCFDISNPDKPSFSFDA